MLERSKQVALLAVCRGWAQLNRVATNFLVVPMASELELDVSAKAALVFAFYYGYTATQVPGGIFAQKCGARFAMFCALFFNGIFIALIPLAAKISTTAIWFCIMATGLAQGPDTPCNNAMFAVWIPKRERPWAVGCSDSGVYAGQALSGFLAPVLASAFGWRNTYVIFGVVEILVSFLWLAIALSDPADSKCITKKELADIRDESIEMAEVKPSQESSTPQTKPEESATEVDDGFTLVKEVTSGSNASKDSKKSGSAKALAKNSKVVKDKDSEKGQEQNKVEDKSSGGLPLYLFNSAAVWAVILAHVAHNYCRHTFSWLPTYFDEVLHIDSTMVGSILFFPEVLGVGIRFLCPPMAKILADRGYTLAESRKLFTGVGCFGTLIGTAWFLSGSTPLVVGLALTVVSSLQALHTAGYRSNYLDLSTVEELAKFGIQFEILSALHHQIDHIFHHNH